MFFYQFFLPNFEKNWRLLQSCIHFYDFSGVDWKFVKFFTNFQKIPLNFRDISIAFIYEYNFQNMYFNNCHKISNTSSKFSNSFLQGRYIFPTNPPISFIFHKRSFIMTWYPNSKPIYERINFHVKLIQFIGRISTLGREEKGDTSKRSDTFAIQNPAALETKRRTKMPSKRKRNLLYGIYFH